MFNIFKSKEEKTYIKFKNLIINLYKDSAYNLRIDQEYTAEEKIKKQM